MAVSSSVDKMKLNYDDVCDMILAKEVCRIDFGEFSSSESARNVDNRGRGHDRSSSKSRGKSKTRSGQQITCWSCGKQGHIKKNYRNQESVEDDMVNVVVEKNL